MTDTEFRELTDDELLSETDLLHLQQMEQLLLKRGYVKGAHGFWISREQALAARAGPPTVDDIENDEE